MWERQTVETPEDIASEFAGTERGLPPAFTAGVLIDFHFIDHLVRPNSICNCPMTQESYQLFAPRAAQSCLTSKMDDAPASQRAAWTGCRQNL